jgi:hypothetical protein
MVSGHLVHCRKNSWPPVESVARTALQLVRRSLVSIANRFSFHLLFMVLLFVICAATWCAALILSWCCVLLQLAMDGGVLPEQAWRRR